MFMGAYSRKYRELDKEMRLKRRDSLRQDLVDKRDVVRRASRETSRRQRMLEEKKRSDEEAETRRREDVLEQRRQQQRDGMDMMRSFRRNLTRKTKVTGRQQDIEVQFYGFSPKPLGHGVSKLNGVRVVQGSKVEMRTRPWKTSHVTFDLEAALKAVNSQSKKGTATEGNRDSLEGSPSSPEDESKRICSSTENSIKTVQADSSVGCNTVAFMRSHDCGHRAIQSSDLSLEDIAPDDSIEGTGGDLNVYCCVTTAGGEESGMCGGQEVDVSMDSIDGGLHGNEAHLDERNASRPQQANQKETLVDCVSEVLPQEAAVLLPVSPVDESIASQKAADRWNGGTTHETTSRRMDIKVSDTESMSQCVSFSMKVETHSTTSPSPSLRDSLDGAVLQEPKRPSNTHIEPTMTTSSQQDPSYLQLTVCAEETVESGKPQSCDVELSTAGAGPGDVAPSSLAKRKGSRNHLFMSSVVMNTPASSTVQAALSQYLAGRPSAIVGSKHGSNSLRNQSTGRCEGQSDVACRKDSRLAVDTSTDGLSVAVASEPGETVDCEFGCKLLKASSEQKLTGILKKPRAKRPSSASGVDAMRSSLDKTADIMKKTVRFADFHHNVKFISSSPADSSAISSVKLKKKRSHSAPVSRTVRRPDKTDSTVAQMEAALVASVARKSSQSQLKPGASVKTLTGNRTAKKGWEVKSANESGGEVKTPGLAVELSGLKKAGLDVMEVQGEDMVGRDQLDAGKGISLDKTPTDDEINQLWNTVRARLRYQKDVDSAGDPTLSIPSAAEASRGLKVRCVNEGNEPVLDGHMAIQTDNHHCRNRSPLTNRPTMAAPVIAFRDVSQEINSGTQKLHAPTARPPSPVIAMQLVSHPQPETCSVATSVYSDSFHTVTNRPPAYVRHYQQQAELALMRGSMRAPATVRSYRLPSKSRDVASGKNGNDRMGVRDGRLASNGKKPMTSLSVEEMQVLQSLERLNSKLDEKQAVLQSAHNTVGTPTMTVKTIQPQQRQKATPSSVGTPYRASVRQRTLSDMPKNRVRRNPHAVAAAAIAAAQSHNSRTQPHVPIHRQALYNM